MTEPNGELDRILDAATHSIGNEPNDDGSFDDFEDADKDAVNARGNRDVAADDETPVQDERSTDSLGVEEDLR